MSGPRGIPKKSMMKKQFSVNIAQGKPQCLIPFTRGREDMRILLNYLFSRSSDEILESKIELLNILKDKGSVNNASISFIMGQFVLWYEVTIEELLGTCISYGMFTPEFFCFCGHSPELLAFNKESDKLQSLQYRFHRDCEFVSWIADVYQLQLTEALKVDIYYRSKLNYYSSCSQSGSAKEDSEILERGVADLKVGFGTLEQVIKKSLK